jgi:hypothetical protein
MAFITVTSTPNTIQADFGVYYGIVPEIKDMKAAYDKHVMSKISLNDGYVTVIAFGEIFTFVVSYNGAPETLKIDSVDGVVPTSNQHLYEMLVAIKG